MYTSTFCPLAQASQLRAVKKRVCKTDKKRCRKLSAALTMNFCTALSSKYEYAQEAASARDRQRRLSKFRARAMSITGNEGNTLELIKRDALFY